MGIGLFSRTCSTNYSTMAPAPNPDPKRWVVLRCTKHQNAYVLLVKYLDATNYEGKKLMVFRGQCPNLGTIKELDPHFQPGDFSPVARFRPDDEGTALAEAVAKML